MDVVEQRIRRRQRLDRALLLVALAALGAALLEAGAWIGLPSLIERSIASLRPAAAATVAKSRIAARGRQAAHPAVRAEHVRPRQARLGPATTPRPQAAAAKRRSAPPARTHRPSRSAEGTLATAPAPAASRPAAPPAPAPSPAPSTTPSQPEAAPTMAVRPPAARTPRERSRLVAVAVEHRSAAATVHAGGVVSAHIAATVPPASPAAAPPVPPSPVAATVAPDVPAVPDVPAAVAPPVDRGRRP